MASPVLRQKLSDGKFFVVPGIQDMIAAVVADRVGFDVVYGTGYWLTASAYGLPDAGIASYTEMVDRMRTLARTSKAAVIADADTGYGGLLNVHHTVKGYEAAGVAAVQMEDQEFPKKCGHTPGKRLIPPADMAEKLRVAVDARTDPNLVIIARTDAMQSEGLDGVLRRLEAYAKAGADVLFPEALTSEEDMRRCCETFDLPVMANMSNGGYSPVPNAGVLAEIGYAFAIYPSLTSLVAVGAMEQALLNLKEKGIGQPDGLFSFNEFCSMIGFEDVWAFEKKWARD
ncbi:isocitrate lyase/PEP mutase family protein [Sandaracinobacteroides hominis]|uniref:isocitrate lyase/PEP mutase family protein n=1 Tax=Sandaracinobacteroides hominis TaxID=2780086 RepID=UPI0018F40763|nr:isocitrate lyase/PEP mutase family protein [Sandaracinobacteroides hominis]